MNLEKEIGKIDIKKIREIEHGQSARFGESFQKNTGIYLAKPGRMTPDNIMMAMGHEGGGVIRMFLEWDDYEYDETGLLMLPGTSGRDTDYLRIDYENFLGTDIAAKGKTVDPKVALAVSAYAAISKYAAEHGLVICPFVPGPKAGDAFKSRLPQKFLDLNTPDDQVRQQLVEYLR